MHIISTGSLAIFSPTGVSPIQEASWYFLYAALFWVVVIIVLYKKRQNENNKAAVHEDIASRSRTNPHRRRL